MKEVRKNMKNYYVRFQELDKQSKSKASKVVSKKSWRVLCVF